MTIVDKPRSDEGFVSSLQVPILYFIQLQFGNNS